MTSLTSIIPGKVDNRGIKDDSIPEYTPVQVTRPLHCPVIHGVFPKGKLASEVGTVWLQTKDIAAVFGDINDPDSSYYGPTSVLIQRLIAGGQASVGIRRLSANNAMARTAVSAFVQKIKVPDFERDMAGNFVRDQDGNKIPVPGKEFDGLSIEIKLDPDAKTKAVGNLTRRSIAGATEDDPVTEVFPIYDGMAGVGDLYNDSGMNFGVSPTAFQFGEVAKFVKATGVFPFNLKTFRDNKAGKRIYAKTQRGRESVEATLFDTLYLSTRYNLKLAFGEYTGTNANRKVVPIPAPYSGVHVYQQSIDALCQALYAVEKPNNTSLVEVLNVRPYKQMNPFTAQNHSGIPYYAVTVKDTTTWDMTYAVKASGGINPFYDNEGKLPDYLVREPVDDPFNLLGDAEQPLTRGEAWQINNALIAEDMEGYVSGIEQSNVTRNRQSVFWDVGYSQDVKDTAIRLLAARKDIIVMPCATIYEPSKANALAQVYSRSVQLNNMTRMYPESEYWGTPSCRASINLIEALAIDELTGDYFSGNLDLAYAFAQFAGNDQGVIVPSKSPGHADNRILRTMHSPNIEFESDVQSADNFERGCITLRPYDSGDRLFRPALVTIYSNVDSVLKDLITNFICVCIEKICQDCWNYVCGDTNYSANNYVSLFKDRAERECRDRVGALARNIRVEPGYFEGTVGSKAIMQTQVHAYFNKAKYMMTMDLFAHNEEELGTN
jgi:hypothetical protein